MAWSSKLNDDVNVTLRSLFLTLVPFVIVRSFVTLLRIQVIFVFVNPDILNIGRIELHKIVNKLARLFLLQLELAVSCLLVLK